jgi:predicted nucleic acid-binding protein
MRRNPRLFLDTSVIFAAILSPSGGSRLLFKVGETGACRLLVGSRVLAEADGVVRRKAPDSRAILALLLDRAAIQVGPEPSQDHLALARSVVDYEPDAHILAESIAADPNYFVTLDRKHFLECPCLAALPVHVGAPDECLAWLRARLR